MAKPKNRRPQSPKPPRGRNLPTSGFGIHPDELKDLDKTAARGSWANDADIQDQIENWREYV